MNQAVKQVEQKLAAARTRLILDKPFLGALVLRLPLIEAEGNWCSSSATDARSIYYNTDYMASLSLSQIQFVLAHEALHCGLSHFARRNNRDLNRWNIACDHAVNLLLTEDGLELAPGALLDSDFRGLAAEEIYPFIKQDSDEETLDQHLYDNPEKNNPDYDSANPDQQNPPDSSENQQTDQSQEPGTSSGSNQDQQQNLQKKFNSAQKDRTDGNNNESDSNTSDSEDTKPDHAATNESPGDAGKANHANDYSFSQAHNQSDNTKDPKSKDGQQPPSLSAQEREQLNVQWQQRLAGAAQQAAQAGKMKGSVARLVERLLRSSVPWRTVLARFMSGSSRQDYNITRPSQRREGDAILPSLYSRQTNMLIAVDTSGSIDREELSEFIAEVNAIKSLINARITILACDSDLDANGPWVFEPWEQLLLPASLRGGGGTDFRPVFDWISSNKVQLDLVVYFTDARGRFPEHQAATETLWLVKGGASVPWGQRIQLN